MLGGRATEGSARRPIHTRTRKRRAGGNISGDESSASGAPPELNEGVFVSVGARLPKGVIYDTYLVE